MADILISGNTVGFSASQNNTAEAIELGSTYPGKIFFTKDGNIVLGARIFGVSIRTDKTEDEALTMSDEYSKVLFFTSDKQTIVLNKKKYGVDESSITALQEAIDALEDDLATEKTTRANADTTLQSNIDAEVTRAKKAESDEATARASADSTLQSNIGAEVTRAKKAESDEATARESADTKLQSQITTLTQTVEDDAEVKAEALSDLDIRTSALEDLKGRTYQPLTFGTKTFNGTTAQEITAADLGISSAFQLIDNCSLEITITPKFTPDSIDKATGMAEGDFARVGNKLYIYKSSAWHDITGVNSYTYYTPTFDDGTAGSTEYGIVKFLNADGDELIQAVYHVNYKTPDQSFDPQKGWVFTDNNNKEWYFGADSLWHKYGDSGSYALKANTYTKQQVDKLVEDEATARTNADSQLQTNISNEATARQSADTKLQENIDNKYTKPDDGIPYTDLDSSVQASLDKADSAIQTVDSALSSTSTNPVQNKVVNTAINAKYTKPSTGIPFSDLSEGVQDVLDNSENAVQTIKVNGTEVTKSGTTVDIPLAVADSKDGAMSKTDKKNLDTCVSGIATIGTILTWE